MSEIREECGVFGIFSKSTYDIARSVYYGLFALQHRGQESCGIVVNDNGLFASYKDAGIVNDVFTPEVLESLGQGNIAIGHVRYGTADEKGRTNAQPIVVNHIKGRMALANNGSLTNYVELREKLELEGHIFHSTSDAEIIANILTLERIKTASIEDALNNAMHIIKGAYSLAVMTATKLVAARDENGIRPLCYGETEDGTYVIASESCALDSAGAKYIRDLKPGEIVVFEKEGIRSITDHCNKRTPSLCVFEYIYFARPDSIIDGVSVHEARLRAGAFLATEHPVEADVVIGVPDSGIDAAIGYSRQSGIPYGVGLIKNKYIGRTFIAPKQSDRETLVKIKLNPVSSTVKGKRVILIDDSIVRGTTGKKIVKLLRDAGATGIHMRLASPTFLNPCYYGTDIASREVLLACNHTIEEMAKIIGVDSLAFLSIDNARRLACPEGCANYCLACFDGIYPTEIYATQRKKKYDFRIGETNQ
ncbi:MAG TPA: amidophosphoribosyltransferase [Clostridia bacterium]|nr:amidophosphoribosyltransferase [Clostridia bacterium]